LGIELRLFEVRNPTEFDSAFAAMTEAQADALLQLGDPFFFPYRAKVAALALQHRLPSICPYNRQYVEAGYLIGYGPSVPDRGQRIASYVDRILKGAKPAELPVEQPMKFELAINLTTAQALGLTIPPTLLFRADEVIRAAPAAAVPRPPEVPMTPPAADLPREVAAFSGTWEGAWNSVVASRLVVESINADTARVVYAWADHPRGRFKGGWARVDAKVLPGGKLQWQSRESKAIFTFTMAKDRMSLEGEREEAGSVSAVLMKKISE
jgi:hypothetical protein